ncbi:MAG: GTP-binding protein [Pseudomonadota bacterium]
MTGIQRHQRIPILVFTGFLGSGKTTVLNYLTQQAALSRTLVLINEFGEIGLDHELVAHSKDDVVIEMSSGCLCCTIRGDLAKTLREAPSRFARGGEKWFDRVIIETTGLADPAPILHTLMNDMQVSGRYNLAAVITAVDAVNGDDTLNRQTESVKQAAMADQLLITKTDLADARTTAALRERLGRLNPGARQVVASNGVVDPTSLLRGGYFDPTRKSVDVQNWLNEEAYTDSHDHHHHDHDHDHDHDVNRHDAHIRSICFTVDEPIRGEVLDTWLDMLLKYRGADFLRIKGIINIADIDRPMVIHGVQHIFHPPVVMDAWPSDDRRSRIVFITRNIDESILRQTLDVLTNSDIGEPIETVDEAPAA